MVKRTKTKKEQGKREKVELEDNSDREEPSSDLGEERIWLATSEAVKYLGISRQTLYNLMDDGTLPFYVLKGVRKRRLRKQDLDALLERGQPNQSKTAR